MIARVEALIEDAKAERTMTARVIRGIHQVNLHKDYLAYNCDTLFQFCRSVLSYDGGAAARRIEAAELLGKAPQVAEQIERGELTVTNVAMIHRVQRKAREKNVEIPVQDLIKAAVNTDTRTAERKCLELAVGLGVDVDPERRRFEAEIEDLLSALSHTYPRINKESLIRLAVHEMHGKVCAEKKADASVEVKNPAGGHVPSKLREAVRQRDQHSCDYRDQQTKQRCGRRRQLEIDHIVPRAKGGKTEFANLRLLCRFHNQLAAREHGLRRPRRTSSARKFKEGAALNGAPAPRPRYPAVSNTS